MALRSTRLSRRGSVLIHVLITGVIVAFISAGMLRMVLMNYATVDRVTKGAANKKEAEAMLGRVVSYWNTAGVCSSFSGFNCSSSFSPCTCTGSPAGGTVSPTIVVSGAAPGPYQILLNSSDPQ